MTRNRLLEAWLARTSHVAPRRKVRATLQVLAAARESAARPAARQTSSRPVWAARRLAARRPRAGRRPAVRPASPVAGTRRTGDERWWRPPTTESAERRVPVLGQLPLGQPARKRGAKAQSERPEPARTQTVQPKLARAQPVRRRPRSAPRLEAARSREREATARTFSEPPTEVRPRRERRDTGLGTSRARAARRCSRCRRTSDPIRNAPRPPTGMNCA